MKEMSMVEMQEINGGFGFIGWVCIGCLGAIWVGSYWLPKWIRDWCKKNGIKCPI